MLQAFKLMRKKRIGGVPVIENGGNKAVGNISLRDIQFLLTAPEIYHDYRCVTEKLILRIIHFVTANFLLSNNSGAAIEMHNKTNC